jgi:hypothetical protein
MKKRTYKTVQGDEIDARSSIRPLLVTNRGEYMDRMGYQNREWKNSPALSVRHAEQWLLKYCGLNHAERRVNHQDYVKKAERWIVELLRRGATIPEVWWDLWCTFEVAYENVDIRVGSLAFHQTLSIFSDAMQNVRFDLALEEVAAKRPLSERILSVQCPACKAPIGQLCRGSQKPRVKTPHVDRIDEAKRQKHVAP